MVIGNDLLVRTTAVGLGSVFVVLGAIPILKGQDAHAAMALVAVGAPLIYRGLGYRFPSFLQSLVQLGHRGEAETLARTRAAGDRAVERMRPRARAAAGMDQHQAVSGGRASSRSSRGRSSRS